MKNTIPLLLLLFCFSFSFKSQTCSSPIVISPLDGTFTSLDSFATQNRFFKFTANSYQSRFKFIIPAYGSSGNIYIKLYNDSCSSLSVNQLTLNLHQIGDSVVAYTNQLTLGNNYLIEIGKIVDHGEYINYKLSINGVNAISWGCSTCVPTSTCELICNGSFECLSSQVSGLSQITNAINWGNANAGTSDLFSTGSSAQTSSVPCNYLGTQNPYSGALGTNNYAGIWAVDDLVPPAGVAEYLQTQLSGTMTPGKKYSISFYVSKAENPTAVINSLAVYFSSVQVSYSAINPLPTTYTTSAVINSTAALNNNAWTQINFCYTANGAEKYFIIGKPYGSYSVTGPTSPSICMTYSYTMYGTFESFGYLYVDEVSITPFEVNATASTNSVDVCGNVNLNAIFPCTIGGLTINNYSWSGTGISNPTISNPTATLNTTTNYFVTVTAFDSNNQSCSSTGSVTVISNTISPLTVSSSAATVCPGGTVNISASLPGGTGSFTFFPGNFVGTNFTFNQNATGSYTVSGTGSNGCIQTKTITIYTYSDVLTTNATATGVCPGFSSTLTASGSIGGYTWNPGSLTGANIVVTPPSTTIYTVTGVSLNNCIISKTIQVTVYPLPSISVLPSSTNTICLNSSITMTALGGSFGSYTWQPGGIINGIATLSPTTATTYTVYGTSSAGCVNSATFSIFVNPIPTVNCNTSNSIICPNASSTLTASGASTYTWFPMSSPGSSVAVSPSSSTNYTVIGTSALGCTNSCIVTQSVFPPNNFTVTVTPSVVCGTSGGGTSTLTTPGGSSSYTWYPGGVNNYSLAVTSTSISNPVYTVVSTNTNGCVGSTTAQVIVSDGYATLPAPGTVCQTNTVDLTFGASPYPGGTFSVNGVPSGTLFSQPPGTYTIAYTNTTTLLCTQTATTTIQVFALPATPTITSSSTLACGGGSVSLTALPTGPTYSWAPGGYTGNPYILTPTTTINFSVTAINGACSVTTSDYIINYTPLPCSCATNCASQLSGTINFNPAVNQNYCITGNLYINGSVTFSNSDFKIAPNVTITILPSSTLTIAGCHLYACDNMWQGMVVQQGGRLNLQSGSSLTSFIEDAFVAVDILQTTQPYTVTTVLSADDVTFNKNQVSIRIGEYIPNQTTYPFTIQKCLFTSRIIPFTFQSYPTTATVKLSASGNTSTLQTPYISNSSYTVTTCKAPVSASPSNGIVLNNVGYTNSTGNTYRNIVIGNSSSSQGFNCFDNLREDITASNSNVTISNNVFQNGQRYGRGNSSGGKGIVANSITTSIDVKGAYNNQILINSVSTSTSLNNRFYEKTAAADITGYIWTEVLNTQVYSYINDYNLFTAINNYGDRAFNLKTNRYYTMTLQNNFIYNIKNAMLLGIDNGNYFVGSQGGYGRVVGNIISQNNTISGHPTSTTSAEFCNIGISVQDLFPSATTTIITGGSSSNLIQNNLMQNVHNGIAVSNIGFSGVSIVTNTITMANEPNTYGTPTQLGINAVQLLSSSVVNQNNVSGVSSYSSGVKGISTSANGLLAVRCNTVANTARGLEFNGIQTISMLEDNSMTNHDYGFILDNSAKLTSTLSTFVMGSASRPTNNVWYGAWSAPKYKTATIGGSNAQNGKLYVQYTSSTSTIDPNGSGYTTGSYGTTDYFHPGANSTLLQVTSTVAPSCRISGGGGGSGRTLSEEGTDNIIALLEQTTSDSIIFDENSPEAAFINQNAVYRILVSNTDLMNSSTVLNTFFNSSQGSSLKTLVDLESSIGNLNEGSSVSLNNFSPGNFVESNYKIFYLIYLKTKDNTYNSTDSLALINLANSCPYTQGFVVHQARSLYNVYYNTYKTFSDNCGTIASRKGNKIKDDPRVILNSQIYPNPNTGHFTISFANITEKQSVEITIFDVSGKQLYKDVKFINNKALEVNYNLLNGVYTLRVKLPSGTYETHKLIINK